MLMFSQLLRSLGLLFLVFFQGSVHHEALHSFPTRRSSDLSRVESVLQVARLAARLSGDDRLHHPDAERGRAARSEEYTSELQSPYDLVCRLLLEKKNYKRQAHQRRACV